MFYQIGSAQTSTNLEQFYQLIDRSVDEIDITGLSINETPRLTLILPDDYKILGNRILGSFNNKLKNILIGENSTGLNVKYSLIDASVEYGEPEKDGFFGDFSTNRIIKYSGSILVLNNGAMLKNWEFSLSEEDRVPFSDIVKIENRALPFTQGRIPDEPLFSSLLEPIIAIGTTVVTVFLLFSVRSN